MESIPQFILKPSSRCELCRRNDLPLLHCSVCLVTIHSACYGLSDEPDIAWICERCTAFAVRPADYVCKYCEGSRGALRAIKGNWAHVVCLNWLHCLRWNPRTNELAELGQFSKRLCCYCEKTSRFSFMCKASNCDLCFHPKCAQEHGVYPLGRRPFAFKCQNHFRGNSALSAEIQAVYGTLPESAVGPSYQYVTKGDTLCVEFSPVEGVPSPIVQLDGDLESTETTHSKGSMQKKLPILQTEHLIDALKLNSEEENPKKSEDCCNEEDIEFLIPEPVKVNNTLLIEVKSQLPDVPVLPAKRKQPTSAVSFTLFSGLKAPTIAGYPKHTSPEDHSDSELELLFLTQDSPKQATKLPSFDKSFNGSANKPIFHSRPKQNSRRKPKETIAKNGRVFTPHFVTHTGLKAFGSLLTLEQKLKAFLEKSSTIGHRSYILHTPELIAFFGKPELPFEELPSLVLVHSTQAPQ